MTEGTRTSAGVSDNRAQKRFELAVDGQTAVLVYERTADKLTLIHTEMPEHLRGRAMPSGDVTVNRSCATSVRLTTKSDAATITIDPMG